MRLKKIGVKENINLGALTSLKIGGKARYFYLAENIEALRNLLQKLKDYFYLLGNGSNLLIKDKVIRNPVIRLGQGFKGVTSACGLLEVGSSTLLSFLIQYCVQNDLAGLEGLAGMPATIGGMLASNASSFGVSIFDCLEEVECVDARGDILRIKKNEINYSYRRSSLRDKIVLKAYFRFLPGKGKVRKNVQKITEDRWRLQDFSFPSCGSVFKNPSEFVAAGKLIEEAGFKGKERGRIRVSEKHANFILNLGGGKYKDADYLIKKMKDSVYKREGIILEEEIERWA